jgi:hypothetical protein
MEAIATILHADVDAFYPSSNCSIRRCVAGQSPLVAGLCTLNRRSRPIGSRATSATASHRRAALGVHAGRLLATAFRGGTIGKRRK